jgi:hypothetical protein
LQRFPAVASLDVGLYRPSLSSLVRTFHEFRALSFRCAPRCHRSVFRLPLVSSANAVFLTAVLCQQSHSNLTVSSPALERRPLPNVLHFRPFQFLGLSKSSADPVCLGARFFRPLHSNRVQNSRVLTLGNSRTVHRSHRSIFPGQ